MLDRLCRIRIFMLFRGSESIRVRRCLVRYRLGCAIDCREGSTGGVG
jgi:hypothetical protein